MLYYDMSVRQMFFLSPHTHVVKRPHLTCLTAGISLHLSINTGLLGIGSMWELHSITFT